MSDPLSKWPQLDCCTLACLTMSFVVEKKIKKLRKNIDQQSPSVVDFIKKDFSILLHVSMCSSIVSGTFYEVLIEMVEGYTIDQFMLCQ